MRTQSIDRLLIILAAITLIAGLYLALFWAPRENTMGDVQRIFYIHVPAAWTSFVAFFLVFVYSIAYLARRRRTRDALAAACAEVGLVFATINLATGPIWARPVWGIWWTWDARLTMMLVLWLMYVAYVMLRHYMIDPERRATFSAVIGIIGFLNVPIVYMSIRWWRTQHPQPVIAGGSDSGLDPKMRLALLMCWAAFILLGAILVRKRVQLSALTDELDALQAHAEGQHS